MAARYVDMPPVEYVQWEYHFQYDSDELDYDRLQPLSWHLATENQGTVLMNTRNRHVAGSTIEPVANGPYQPREQQPRAKRCLDLIIMRQGYTMSRYRFVDDK